MQRTSPVDRALLARALTQIAAAAPRAIAIDMAFVQATDDQQALIAALRGITVPVAIVYADPEGDRGVYWDYPIALFAREKQNRFWAALAGSTARKVSPAIGVDSARIARHWPQTQPSTAPLLAYALAGTPAALRGDSGAIRYRKLDPALLAAAGTDIDAATGAFPAYPLDLMADPIFAADYRPMLAGRIVLVASDTFGADQIATPITRIGGLERIAGVAVHAHMLRQALDRDFPAPLGLGWIAGLALGWLTAYLALAAGLRARSGEERAFARGALSRFLPESVAREILADPARLDLKGEERELTLMLTDLEGFTRFCNGRDPGEAAAILNAYLDAMSTVVLAHGERSTSLSAMRSSLSGGRRLRGRTTQRRRSPARWRCSRRLTR